MNNTPATIELLLIHNDPPCRKCRKTEKVLREVIEESTAEIKFRSIIAGSPEASRYGAVITPMVLLNGSGLCAGIVPRAAGVLKLIERETGN